MRKDDQPELVTTPSARKRSAFVNRGGVRLLSNIVFHKAAGKRAHALRIQFGRSKATSITLKNVDFFVQYARAVDMMADFLEIPADSLERERMRATAADFLSYYSLKTTDVTMGEGAKATKVTNVVIDPNQWEQSGELDSPASTRTRPAYSTVIATDGRVRGITFQKRKGPYPARIHVHPPRGERPSFSLENTSFSVQYGRAVAHLADAWDLEPGDPLRMSMEKAGPAFLTHYGLVTGPLNIADAVINLDTKRDK